VPAAKLKNLGELCVWLYGSKSQDQRPLIQSQNPDLRVLDEILRTPNGTAALRQRLPLGVSRDIGKGDPQLLREALVAAKDSLQTARGRALTGYDGQTDLIKLADDIVTIADGIVADLKQQQARDREKRRQGRLTP
jgi:chemotaxis response regulator CheB